jgi:hypothetical protein
MPAIRSREAIIDVYGNVIGNVARRFDADEKDVIRLTIPRKPSRTGSTPLW